MVNPLINKFLIFLLFVLINVSCSNPSNWSIDYIHSDSPSSRLKYYAKTPYSEVEIEFLKTSSNIYSHINIMNRKCPKDINNSPLVSIIIDTNTFNDIGFLQEGDQRIALSKNIAQKLLEGLKNEKQVFIKINEYETLIESKKFSQQYEKLLKMKTLLKDFISLKTFL